MRTIRRAAERGHADHGWLKTHHTFSFANYYDPRHMGFGPLRVINDDTVAGGGGFPPHSHRDMEIISYVIEGGLEHRDSMGTGSVIRPGDVQRMSAGTGVVHAEYNASKLERTRFLQIWILPRAHGLPPGYEQKSFPREEKAGRLRLVASPDGADGSLRIEQDAGMYATVLEPGQQVEHAVGPDRRAWLHVVKGTVVLDGERLEGGDGVAITGEEHLTLAAAADGEGEAILFDMHG